MSPGFVKVYSSILASSVWGESLPTRVVWITMLAMADRNGLVEASSDGIARAANLSLKQSDAALEVLSSPDPRSKSQNDEHEGRRIERIDGGYRILNYLKYRELQTEKQKADAERQKRHRATERDKSVTSQPVTVTSRRGHKRSRPVAPEAEAEAKAETTKTKPTDSDESGPKILDTTPPSVLLSFGDCETLRQKWESKGRTCEYPRFRKTLKALFVPAQRYTPAQLAKAIDAFDELAKQDGPKKSSLWHLQRFVDHIGVFVDWAEMPATDDRGNLTARGKEALASA